MKRIPITAAMMALAVLTFLGAGTPMQLPPSTLPDDDGGNPDVVTWGEFLEQWLTPIELPKNMIIRIDEKYCYPHPAVSIKMEIVREEDDAVWVRGLPPEDPAWSRRMSSHWSASPSTTPLTTIKYGTNRPVRVQ